jgi:hypothetical protein
MLPLSDEYFRRIEAVEFAVKSDDGKEPRNFKKADLVLVGVSRTSKTPLSTYLANRGIKVANLPLVLGVPPHELDECARKTASSASPSASISSAKSAGEAAPARHAASRPTTPSASTCARRSSSPARSSARTPSGPSST